ncbi:hypothetical protein GCM10010428_34400 [Actinosynnema pretiosum subsp. pretiosum]
MAVMAIASTVTRPQEAHHQRRRAVGDRAAEDMRGAPMLGRDRVRSRCDEP